MTATTMTERYLGAVGSNLPASKRDDIIRELSENIAAQMEDEAEARGRPLDDDEQAAILKRFGNPLVVAAQYREDERSVSFGRQLIGPELFPTYAKVLTINVAITLLVGVGIFLATGGSIGPALYGMAVPLVIQFLIVTGIFVVLHRRFAGDPDRWDPRTLGPSEVIDYATLDGIAEAMVGKRPTDTVPYTTSALELGLTTIGLVWWLAIGLPASIGLLKPGPGWADLYLPVTVLIVASLVVPLVNLARPTWTRFRVGGRALLDAASVALMLVSLSLGSWVVLVDPATATTEQADLVAMIDQIVRITLVFSILIVGASAVFELRRFIQLRRAAQTAPERT